MIACGAACLVGLHVFRARVACETGYNVRSDELALVRPAGWMTPEIAREVESAFDGLPTRLSLLDPQSADRVARCLRSSAWVRRVDYVRLDRPGADQTGGLEVAVEFRRPVAFVEVGDGRSARYVLIDREGVRLGQRAYPAPHLGDRVLLVVDGVTSSPPPAGRQWADAAVQAGAEVARVLRRRVGRYDLSRIDVSNVGGREDPRRADIVLTTRGGTRIVWGSPSSRAADQLEGTPSEKLRCLEVFCERLGGLDGLVEEVDLVTRQWRRRLHMADRRDAIRG